MSGAGGAGGTLGEARLSCAVPAALAHSAAPQDLPPEPGRQGLPKPACAGTETYPACGSGIVCRYPRGMALLVVAGLCLSFPQPPGLKLASPGAASHLYLNPGDVPIDVSEGPREAGSPARAARAS